MIGRRYGIRPSQILRLKSDWTCWQVDEACALTGMQAEARMQNGEQPFGSGAQSGKGKFKSALGKVMRKMKIPKSGIW